MSKNVLILSSTPRKNGNSDALCDAFAKGAVESGNTVEKIRVADKSIAYCNGCGSCTKSKRCVIKDDMEGIASKMISADVIVLATPVYFYSVCGQLKTLIDRTAPFYQELTGKEFYFIATAADINASSLDRTFETLRGFTEDCIEDSKEMGVICGTGLWERGEADESEHYAEAYEMGKSV